VLRAILKPYTADDMAAMRVNPALNRPSFRVPDCLTPN
jgi:hypothetical protein